MAQADRPVQLSEEVLEEIKQGQEAAIGAVRGFLSSLDETLAGSASPSQVEQIADSALKMADKLVETQYDFLKRIVHSASEAVGGDKETEEA